MIYDKMICGRYVDIRSASLDDAEQTLKLRQDPQKTIFLHQLDNEIDKQKRWLKNQIEKTGDYFFVILDKKNEIIGTIGIYDIEGKKGQSGRLLSYGNSVQSFEGMLLAIRFAFDYLVLDELWGDVDARNTTALEFNKMFGFRFDKLVYDSELNRQVHHGTLYESDFENYAKKIERFIYRNQSRPILPWEVNE